MIWVIIAVIAIALTEWLLAIDKNRRI